MSLLTNNEKIIIERLKQSPNGRNFLANVIDRELSQARIRLDKERKQAFILIEKNYYDNLSDSDKKRIDQIVNWVNYIIFISFGLVDFLDQCGYVTLRRPDVKENIVTIGPGLTDENAHKFEIVNPTIVEQLTKYIDNVIVLSDEVEKL